MQVETLEGLKRRVNLSVSLADVEQEVESRLKRLSKTVKMAGFRPGKVPFKMVEQSYGPEMRMEVLNAKVGDAFNKAVSEGKLRVAGMPDMETDQTASNDQQLTFKATFEVYPDITIGDLSSVEVERLGVNVGDAEIDKTVEILRKQRRTFAEQAGKVAANDDRVVIDFKGTLEGVAFDGGTAEGFDFVLGEKRMLPDFETGVLGMTADQTKTIDVAFPEDYGSDNLKGKTAQFEIKLHRVEVAQLPPVDGEFAKLLGVKDGDLAKMRQEIKSNLEREVSARVRSINKENVLNGLLKATDFNVPAALLAQETESLVQNARSDLAARGIKVDEMPIPADLFQAQAERRVRLGLIVGEIVRSNNLTAKQEQMRARIDEMAASYESPDEVVKWYFSDRRRLAEVEAVVLEDNVVTWAFEKVKAVEKTVTFDELMGANPQA